MSSFITDEPIIDVERRTKAILDVLGDPTLFPVDFLNWLKRYIEQSGITLPASSILGGFKPGSGSLRNMAAGIVFPFAGGSAPSGSLPCDGTAVGRLAFPLLYAEIGTTWGAGDGSTTFNVPDLRGRALFGAGGPLTLGQTDGQAVGSRGGARHQHGTHTHIIPSQWPGIVGGSTPYRMLGDMVDHDVSTDAAQVGPAGTNLDAPNWAAVTYVITTGG